MTVGELKAKLEQFPDDLTVLMPNPDFDDYWIRKRFSMVSNVTRGVNEYDGCVFIDDYVED